MKSYLKASAATAAVLAVAAPAHAGQYVTVFGGMTFMEGQSANLDGFFGSGSFSTSDSTNLGVIGYTSGTFKPTYVTASGQAFLYQTYLLFFTTQGTYASFTTLNADYDFDNGYVIGAAWGCDIGNLSIEGEISYRANNFDAAVEFSSSTYYTGVRVTTGTFNRTYLYVSTGPTGSVSGTPIVSGWNTFGTTSTSNTNLGQTIVGSVNATNISETLHSDITSMAIMANVWWEFGELTDSNITPYVGAGIGWASVEVSVGPGFGNPRWNSDDSGLAWQAGAGLRFDLKDNMSLNIEYRYFAVPDMEFFVAGDELGIDYEVHNVIAGLRWDF